MFGDSVKKNILITSGHYKEASFVQSDFLIARNHARLSLRLNPNFSFRAKRYYSDWLILSHASEIVGVPAQMLLLVVIFVEETGVEGCSEFAI